MLEIVVNDDSPVNCPPPSLLFAADPVAVESYYFIEIKLLY